MLKFQDMTEEEYSCEVVVVFMTHEWDGLGGHSSD